MPTKIKAIRHDMVEITGSPLFPPTDLYGESEPCAVVLYRRGGSAVYQEIDSENPDPQVCCGLGTLGNTLPAPQNRPLVDVVREEHAEGMAALRRKKRRERL